MTDAAGDRGAYQFHANRSWRSLEGPFTESAKMYQLHKMSRQDLSVLWKAQLSEAECASLRQLAEGAG